MGLLKPEDAAYIAGIIDGEGSIGLNVTASGSYRAQIQVSNASRKLIYWLQELLGGYVDVVAPKGGTRPSYHWRTDKREVVANVLAQVSPYLRVKQQQADLVMRFITDCHVGRGRRRTPQQEAVARELCAGVCNLNQNKVGEA